MGIQYPQYFFIFLCLISDIPNREDNDPIRFRWIVKDLFQIVQNDCAKVYSGGSQWTQVTFSNQNEQRHPASNLVHQAANFTFFYSQCCKTRGSSKEGFIEGLHFCHSINLKKAQKSPHWISVWWEMKLAWFLWILSSRKTSVSKFGKLVTSLYQCKYNCRRGRSVKRSVWIICWFWSKKKWRFFQVQYA